MTDGQYPRRITSVGVAGLIAALIGAAAVGSLSLVEAGNFSSAVETIHVKELRRHCEVLASDAFEGRATGSRGGQAAGAYIVDSLRKQRIAVAGADGDYYQVFPPDSRNILALIPGSDPSLRHEYVVIGAHYDHVGYGTARNSRGPIGSIHNGADDNASGTAALLELVQAFASLDLPPKRSLLFVFWDGEENGLLGSAYWAQHPTVPLESIRLVINIDMIGRLRDNRVEVFGARSGRGLRKFVAQQNVDHPMALTFNWETRRDSDHYSFFSRQVPYLMLFTGKHPEYHTPYDDVDRLNVEGIEHIARLLFRTVYAAAELPALPAFRAMALQENGRTQREAEAPLPLPMSRLGVTWDERLERQHVIQLTEIDPSSAAEAAGLHIGDRVVEFDGTPIASADDLRDAVLSAPTHAQIAVVPPGETKPQTRPVRLSGRPDPTGLSWHMDDAEPNSAIVNRVLGGSPAARAGMRVNDRILLVSGSAFSSAPELSGLLERPNGALSLQVERDGQVKVLRIIVRARSVERKSAQKSPA